jgi:CelD/BcsL family acetyltransferase involved in cellulose biosynthesis
VAIGSNSVKTIDLRTSFGMFRKGITKRTSVPARLLVSNDIRDFAEVWPRSDKLGASKCYAFQCADLLELNCRTLAAARNAKPFFAAVVNESDQPLALFPLSIERRGKIRVLTFLDGGLSNYNAPVVFPPICEWNVNDVGTIWRNLRRALPVFDIASFQKMPAHVGDLRNPLSLLQTSPYPYSCHAMTLHGTWKDLSTRLPHRSTLRKLSKGLGKRGRMAFEIVRPEQYDVLVEIMIEQMSQQLLETQGSDWLGPGYRAFFQSGNRLCYPFGPVCLFAFKVDDNIVGTVFGYVVGTLFYGMVFSYKRGEWLKYSPGRLVIEKLIEWCHAEGLSVLDFGIGDQIYKQEYCDVSNPLSQIEIPGTLRGHIFLWIRSMKWWLAKTGMWKYGRRITRRLLRKR